MFVIRQMKRWESVEALNFDERTIHSFKRDERFERVEGIGETVSGFLVDKNHKDGLEKHFLTSTGLIMVRNYNTNRFITVLVARPGQIRRYYKALGRFAPKWLVDVAYENWQKGLNY